MPLTPAMIGVKVRTIGTKRARTSDLGPYFSKNSWAFSTFSCLKSLESGRLNSDGPDLLAEQVARLVAEDRGEHHQDADQPQRGVQLAGGDQQAAW